MTFAVVVVAYSFPSKLMRRPTEEAGYSVAVSASPFEIVAAVEGMWP